ncbi:hypothetical protein ABZU74_33615, partial [Micromonospora sp. NPDC005171]
ARLAELKLPVARDGRLLLVPLADDGTSDLILGPRLTCEATTSWIEHDLAGWRTRAGRARERAGHASGQDGPASSGQWAGWG